MARIRTIKPEFFTSEDIIGLSPLARLFYISLWCEADREGRMKWQLRSLKVRYLPVDDCDIEDVAAELVSAGLVVPYGDRLAYIPAFTRHQHVNKREAPSKLPDPSKCENVPEPEKAGASTCTHPPSTVLARGEGKGREGKNTPTEYCAQAREPAEVPVEIPAAINPTAWADWVSNRRKRRKPISDRAAREQWAALSSLTHDQQAACIASSIRNDYQGLFPEKFTGQPRASPPQSGTRARSIAEDLTDRSWAG